MKNPLKKILATVAAGIATLTMGLSAAAAPVAEATIDTTKTGSLTLYKYDITAAERDNVWHESDYTSTGVYDQTVNDTLGSSSQPKTLPNGDTSYGYAVKGVEFTYLKVADITTFSKTVTVDGNPVNKIAVLYGFAANGTGETMLDAIGLSFADRYTEADATVGGTLMYYFDSDTLIDALRTALAANATTVKNALEAYVSANGGTTMTETDSYGKTAANSLPLGLYLVVETKVPEYITTPTTPFFVSLPMTSVNGTNATDGGERWMYDVTVYPKNASGMPTLEKTVRETKNDTGKNNGTTDDITDGYAHNATASDGDVVDYQVISTLPAITSTASYLTTYTYVDTLSKGITYNQNDIIIEFFTDAACTDKVATWKQTDAQQKFTVAYGNSALSGAYAGGSTMTITMTDAGLAEINADPAVYTGAGDVESGYSQCTMRITYAATVNSDASVVYGDNGNPNTVTLTWKRTSTNYFDTLTDDCHVYTYGIDLTKKFSGGAGDFSKVNFAIHNDTDNYYVTATLIDGVYYVTGHEAEEADKTVFVPTADGKIIVKGLEDDTYTATELQTDNGYVLLKDGIQFTISSAESSDICDVCHKAMLTASATINGDDVDMDADNGSVHALVPLTVINNRGFDLPSTGEVGTWMLSIVGVIGGTVAIALLIMASKKRKTEEN